jgi:hypothetical protein
MSTLAVLSLMLISWRWMFSVRVRAIQGNGERHA